MFICYHECRVYTCSSDIKLKLKISLYCLEVEWLSSLYDPFCRISCKCHTKVQEIIRCVGISPLCSYVYGSGKCWRFIGFGHKNVSCTCFHLDYMDFSSNTTSQLIHWSNDTINWMFFYGYGSSGKMLFSHHCFNPMFSFHAISFTALDWTFVSIESMWPYM